MNKYSQWLQCDVESSLYPTTMGTSMKALVKAAPEQGRCVASELGHLVRAQAA